MLTFLNESAPLESYCHDLTAFAQRGAFSPLVGQEAVVNRVFEALQSRLSRNPILLAEDGSRRWAVVAEVIRRIAVGEVPESCPIQQVIALDYEALFSHLSDDTFTRHERLLQRLSPLLEQLAQAAPGSEAAWNALNEVVRQPSLEEWIAPTLVLERLQGLFIMLHQAAGSCLLFVDQMHRLVGGEGNRYPFDATELLNLVLARRQIQLIGACTVGQYRQSIERVAALGRRFQTIGLPEDE